MDVKLLEFAREVLETEAGAVLETAVAAKSDTRGSGLNEGVTNVSGLDHAEYPPAL
jgi:hypothetical protein